MSGKSNIKSAGYYLYLYLLYNDDENGTWKQFQKKTLRNILMHSIITAVDYIMNISSLLSLISYKQSTPRN